MSASGAVQTTVTVNPDPGVAGAPYDDGLLDIETRIATVAIPFGSAVVMVAGGTCKVPTASGDILPGSLGVAMVDHSKPTGVGYEIGDRVNVLRKGRVWVASETAATEQTIPYVRYTAGSGGTAGTVQGGIAGATDAGKNAQPASGFQFITGSVAAGLVGLDVNTP